jgi:CubicO group peptidase (beta-lactamase class C family)
MHSSELTSVRTHTANEDRRAPAEAKFRLSSLIQQHPLASFFVLAYAISWLLWAPAIISGGGRPTGFGFVLLALGSLVPSTVAIVLVAMLHGKSGVRTLLRRLRIWRVGAGWWAAVVLLSTPALGAVGLSVLLGGDAPDLAVTIPGFVLLFLFFVFPGSAGGEEIGWRGFALPRLQARRSALAASVVLGAAWGVWHLPLYLMGTDIRPLSLFAPWVLLTIASSVIYTWMYNGTGGSLLIVVVFHAVSNLPLTVFLEPLDDQVVLPFLIYVALMILAASVVVAVAGPATLSRTRAKQVAGPDRPATAKAPEAGEATAGHTRSRIRARRGPIVTAVALAALVLGAAYLVSKPGSEAPAANGEDTGASFAEIENFVRGEMAAQRIPGLALGIVEGDRIAYVRGFGTADDAGREVTPQTPFIIGSVSKSFTALAVMQLVEANKIELDAPVQRFLPWFRVADEQASAVITVRHLLNHTSGLSTKTGRTFQGNGDTSDTALEQAVRKLNSAALTAPVGSKHQYSTINYSVLGLIVQTVAGESYERYVQTRILDPLQMRHSYTSEAAAEPQGLATGHNYWFGRPRAADLPYNRGLVPAGYLISSAEDMAHYLISQLNGGRYEGTSVLSPDGIVELHRPAVQTPEANTSYGMGWFAGPINDIPAIHHQGETFNFHANVVLIPQSRRGVVVLMNAENSLDLFTNGRMATIADGVTSLLEGRQPPSPPSNIAIFVVYAAVSALLLLQARGIAKSVVALRQGRIRRGRIGPWWRVGLLLALSLVWALFVLVLVPKQLGMPLSVIATGFPDLVYLLLASALLALGWAVVRAAWTYAALRGEQAAQAAAHEGVPG